MKFQIETSPGYGTKQGIMPRFYLQLSNLCQFLNAEPFITEIPSKFLNLVIPELTNFYDVHKKFQANIQDYLDGLKNGRYYKIDEDGSTTFLRNREFEISNLTKDFFIRGKVLLVLFFKSDIISDDYFKISEYYFCDENKFDIKFHQYLSSKKTKYKPLLETLKKASKLYLNDFTKVRGDIEHGSFKIDKFELCVQKTIRLIEPKFQNEFLSKKIEYYYENLLDIIEKLTVYFVGINCEEKNPFYKLYVNNNSDYPNLIYKYHYRIMEMSFVFETVRCAYD